MIIKKALIVGISGQDGSYLARFLISKGYSVVGTSRNVNTTSFINLEKLEISSRVTLTSMDVTDFFSVMQIIKKFEPNEIYNLSGLTSVSLSFNQPIETIKSITLGIQNILDSVRLLNIDLRVYNAGSSECFGNTGFEAVSESFSFRPLSPYAIAKVSAYWQVAMYRESHGLFCCTGILFNHESSLRTNNFVTKKIINSAREIVNGNLDKLTLGNINITRDWGWAAEYVEAMWLMLQASKPNDYVIATGKSYTLKQFIENVFVVYGLDWTKYIRIDNSLIRPSDILTSNANPVKANIELGWHAKTSLEQLINKMISNIN